MGHGYGAEAASNSFEPSHFHHLALGPLSLSSGTRRSSPLAAVTYRSRNINDSELPISYPSNSQTFTLVA